MSPSLYRNRKAGWKDFRKFSGLEQIQKAYASGDYTTAIKFLDSLLNAGQNVNGEPGVSHEHIFLARAMCYQQLREFRHVLADTKEVIRTINSQNNSFQSNGSLNGHNINYQSIDQYICYLLALWLRSLAYESLEKWEQAKTDLELLKTLILGKTIKGIVSGSNGVLSTLIPNMDPLIVLSKSSSPTINMHCVVERLRRMSDLVAKENSCRNSVTQAFRLIDDDSSAYSDLAKKFHYRLLLRRPLHPNIHLNMWYTMDLMFVSEMGLFKREDMYGVEGYSLEIKMLEIGNGDALDEFEIQVRPMSPEACEWSGLTSTDWAGVQSNGKGGLEFRIVPANSNNRSDANNMFVSKGRNKKNNLHSNNLRKRFLYVYPKTKIISVNNSNNHYYDDDSNNMFINESKTINRTCHVDEHLLVPLAIGPINLVDCHRHSDSCANHHTASGIACIPADSQTVVSTNDPKFQISSSSLLSSSHSWSTSSECPSQSSKCLWSTDEYIIHSYRAFFLPNGKHLIIKELWDVGIPGKVWDSAFVMVKMIREKILKDRKLLDGKKILDLSTGTGFVGLYLAAFMTSLKKRGIKNGVKTHVILTDLEHALNLIRDNYSLNEHVLKVANNLSIEIKSLKWGDSSKARQLGVIDYVLASDVVYEPDLFDYLIQTLVTVCTPGHTKIFLGYKRRGLTKEEERSFFSKLQSRFTMSLLPDLDNAEDEGQIYIYELSRVATQTFSLNYGITT
ncbi:putative methyltransferase-domain-containing protein [Gigaspora margarita]|uniref:Putative methyltransferase-domain-containing protein n=1 Tax=Gigaspora margarita TaxID=4874 RepID=A0A8H4A7G5_GIGMA|nr:putative methyltransferase-domain-containing protein [Gigaspora margarita]